MLKPVLLMCCAIWFALFIFFWVYSYIELSMDEDQDEIC